MLHRLTIRGTVLLNSRIFTDNRLSSDKIEVDELEENDIRVSLGTFQNEQIVGFEYLTLYPTALVIQFGSDSVGKNMTILPGDCVREGVSDTITHPVDFYDAEYDTAIEPISEAGEPISLGPVVDPIGPAGFEVRIEYDCGEGREFQFVQLGGPLAYCNISLNQPEPQN